MWLHGGYGEYWDELLISRLMDNSPQPFFETDSSLTLDKDKDTPETSAHPSQGSGQELTPGHQGVNSTGGNDVSVLFCTNISIDLDYEELYVVFKQYGTIERMKLRLSSNKKTFVCFILYNLNNSASKAYKSMNGHPLNEYVVEARLCSREILQRAP